MIFMELIKIDKYFGHPLVLNFLNSYNQIRARYNQENNLNYFGINFDEKGIYSVKFYFHVFPILQKEDVELFLPKSNDYFKYIHLYDGYNNQGCAFEVKFLRDNNKPTIGFHYRLKAAGVSFQLVGKPKYIDMTDPQYGPGINFEYNGENTVVKRYYYFKSKSDKEYFAERFNMPMLINTSLIEFSETEVMSKINIWFGTDKSHLIKKLNLFTELEIQYIDQISKQYGLNFQACGCYENTNMKAAYFFRNLSSKNHRNRNVL